MKRSCILLLFIFSILANVRALAQYTTFVGKVTDENGNPLRNAEIMLKRKHKQVSIFSDSIGTFVSGPLLAGVYSASITVHTLDPERRSHRLKVRKISLNTRQSVRLSDGDAVTDNYYHFQVGSDKAIIKTHVERTYVDVGSQHTRFNKYIDLPVVKHRNDILYTPQAAFRIRPLHDSDLRNFSEKMNENLRELQR